MVFWFLSHDLAHFPPHRTDGSNLWLQNTENKTKERKDEIEISFLASFLLETKPVRGILLHQKGKSGKTIHEYGCIITCQDENKNVGGTKFMRNKTKDSRNKVSQ